MTQAFNLVDETFIPCILADGSMKELGLRETLIRAHEIREIRDDSPLVTVSLHRLLLAVLHRNFGPDNLSKWASVWSLGQFDAAVLDTYFNKWRERFDLNHAKYPFFQSTGIEEFEPAPITRLAFIQGNNATLFDHRLEAEAGGWTPAAAARALVTYQAFAVGGGVSKPFNYCHSPAVAIGGYLVLAAGASLFQTLWLNALCYNNQQPIRSTKDDCPAWELDVPKSPERGGTVPNGYLDYLTWQSRRIKLIAGEDAPLRYDSIRMTQGMRLSDTFGPSEPMAAYKSHDEQMLAQGFREGRSLWRDSSALLQQTAGTQKPPQVLIQLEQLKTTGHLPPDETVRLMAFGICTDQAKISFWRQETVPLPLGYLGDQELLGHLADAIQAAEDAAYALRNAVRRVGEIMSAPNPGSKADKDRVSQFVDSLSPDRRYWSNLESPFRAFLMELPDSPDRLDRLGQWRSEACCLAKLAFKQVCDSLEQSPRILKAIFSDDWGGQKKLTVELSKILAPARE